MKKKKITIIISYDYDNKQVASNDKIYSRIRADLMKGTNPIHERIETITVEDNESDGTTTK